MKDAPEEDQAAHDQGYSYPCRSQEVPFDHRTVVQTGYDASPKKAAPVVD
jgi:hypothetical protein